MALIVAGVVLAITVDATYLRPTRVAKRRRRELSHPAEVAFLIPPLAQRTVDYAEQDAKEHWLKEVTLPVNSTRTIELRIDPRVNFTTFALQFGCEQINEQFHEEKPRVTELIEVYTKIGVEMHGIPGVTPGHRINSRNLYQWDRNLSWNVGTQLVRGFKIETHKEGNYRWVVHFFGEEVNATEELTICVSNAVGPGMQCVNRKDHTAHTVMPR